MFATAITDDGEIIDVSQRTDKELEAGRAKWRGRIRLQVCGWPCYLRRSPCGRYHFSHSPGSGHKHPGMSEEHLVTQLQIAQLARAFGGLADLEHRVEAGVVDVLVTSHGGKHWAFEVQLSPHDAAETQRRSQNYANQGLRSIWLMRRPTGDADETTLLLQWDSVKDLSLPYEDGRTVSLASLVLAAVEDELAFREEAAVEHVRGPSVAVGIVNCCDKPAHLVMMAPECYARTQCGWSLNPHVHLDPDNMHHPPGCKQFSAATYLAMQPDLHIKGHPLRMDALPTKTGFVVYRCPDCRKRLRSSWEPPDDMEFISLAVPVGSRTRRWPHWCGLGQDCNPEP